MRSFTLCLLSVLGFAALAPQRGARPRDRIEKRIGEIPFDWGEFLFADVDAKYCYQIYRDGENHLRILKFPVDGTIDLQRTPAGKIEVIKAKRNAAQPGRRDRKPLGIIGSVPEEWGEPVAFSAATNQLYLFFQEKPPERVQRWVQFTLRRGSLQQVVRKIERCYSCE